MLSIGKLTPGRADYYCQQLPGGRDEYYTGGDEEPGVWLGAAAERLGLRGSVDADQFRRILDAHHPQTGEPLGVPATTSTRLAGLDLCFSAPKSVTVAWALAPPEMCDRIAAAHDRALADAVGALEAEAVRARRGAGGHQTVETDGVVAAGFAHRTSRAADPQLHSHVVVANLTPDQTGRWSALDGAEIYRWAKTVGYLYQAALRHHLSTDLGLEWGPVRKGAADLAGIDSAILERFSKRTAQIDHALAGRTGEVPIAVAKNATLATRASKADLPDQAVLREQWTAEAATSGLTQHDIIGLRGRHPDRRVDTAALADRLIGPAGLTEHTATFDRRDVLQALAEAHPAGQDIERLRDDATALLSRAEVVEVESHPRRGGRYSTAELLEVENHLLRQAAARSDAHIAVVADDDLRVTLSDRPTLSEEQRRMISGLVTSGAGVEAVEGRAGTGKTYALDAARAAWEHASYTVIGTALAARAAAELQSGAGIPSTTIDRLLCDLDAPGPLSGLAPRTVVSGVTV
jgi:conjugative relaxase-like TrwC/TraI family protein